MSSFARDTRNHLSRTLGNNENLKLIHLDDIQLVDSDNKELTRNFSTIFVDESTARRGGIGKVSKAYNAQSWPFAIKTISANAEDKPSLEREFDSEYECHEVLSGLEGIPRLVGRASFQGQPVLLMEWIEGITLKQVQDTLALDDAGRLSPLTAAQIGRDLFDLLSRISLVDSSIVHRDISLNNVMVRTSNSTLQNQINRGKFDIVLIDFGSSATQVDASSSLTSSAILRKGTADFAPPEMLSDDLENLDVLRKSPAIDVYAAASVTYALLSGQTPYDLATKNSESKSYYRIKMDTAPAEMHMLHESSHDITQTLSREDIFKADTSDKQKLRESLVSVDSQLVDIILPCLKRAQTERPSAVSIHDALDAFCSSYKDNLHNALSGKPLKPCNIDSIETGLSQPKGNESRAITALKLFAAAIWVLVVITTGVLMQPITISLSESAGAFSLLGWMISLAMALSSAFGVFLFKLIKDARKSYIAASLGLLAATIIMLAFLTSTSGDLAYRLPGIASAVITAAASCWSLLTTSYVQKANTVPKGKGGLLA